LSYICAHANGSAAFDRKESRVIHRSMGEFGAHIPVSSIKGVLGHSFGASGAFQTAASLLAFRHGVVPPTHNLTDRDAECRLNCIDDAPRSIDLNSVLVTSYGYGGVNAYLLLQKPN